MASPTMYSPFLASDARPAANGSTQPPSCKPEVMTVTPALAQEWATLNTRNRPVRYSRVERFARDMKAGKWLLNGETVKIAVNGTILDGQHRLYACIQSGVSFETVVIRGLPLEAQDTIDTGAARTMADQFGLRGEKCGTLLAAITRWAFAWLKGVRMTGHANASPTHAEMIALLEAEPRLRDATAWADHARKEFRPVTGSVYGMAWLLFHGSDDLAAEVFLRKVITGEDCPAGHPALAFRNRMMTARDDGQRLNQHEQLGYMIMAWKAFQEDRTLAKLLPPRGGFTPKTFPEP